ncbi:MAG: TrmH family RNA methyltransferase, partial [Acidimicrobiia bacterium]
IKVVAASPDSETTLWDTDLSGPVAILTGSEAIGLSSHALDIASSTASIPMAGASDSLNASAALAVIAYEARRQRSE